MLSKFDSPSTELRGESCSFQNHHQYRVICSLVHLSCSLLLIVVLPIPNLLPSRELLSYRAFFRLSHQPGSQKPSSCPSTNQPINQSTNQPINQSTNQPINQSTNQPINQSTNQPINQATNQPSNQSTNQSTRSQSRSYTDRTALLLSRKVDVKFCPWLPWLPGRSSA